MYRSGTLGCRLFGPLEQVDEGTWFVETEQNVDDVVLSVDPQR